MKTLSKEINKWKEKQVEHLLCANQMNVGEMYVPNKIMVMHHSLKKEQNFLGVGIGFLLLEKKPDTKDNRIVHLHILSQENSGWLVVMNTGKLFLPRFPLP